MSTLETSLWQWLKTGSPTTMFHAERIENAVARGTPDVEFCWEGRAGQIELKVAKGKGPSWNLPHFTSQQAEWHRRRAKAGGQSWLLVQVNRERFLVPGRSAVDLFKRRDRVTPALLTTLAGTFVGTARDAWALAAGM